MLSRKILNVSNSLGMLAKNILNEDIRSFLALCQSELHDAADQAVDLENMPRIINAGQATECKETLS